MDFEKIMDVRLNKEMVNLSSMDKGELKRYIKALENHINKVKKDNYIIPKVGKNGTDSNLTEIFVDLLENCIVDNFCVTSIPEYGPIFKVDHRTLEVEFIKR